MIKNGTVEAVRHGIARSSKWHGVEAKYKAANPNCACCAIPIPGGGVQIHHKLPFHYCVALGRPDLELDDRNLITLCETTEGVQSPDHHLLVGHLADFKSACLSVAIDALQTFHGMSAEAIRVDPRWLSEVAKKLKPLDQMTQDDRDRFVKLMNDTYPLR